MSKRRFGETQEEYEKRLEKEEIEAQTGIKQGLFESHEKYKQRAENEIRR